MEIYKSQAKRLCARLNKLGIDVNHCQSLDLIANVHGARNWQTLYASTIINEGTLKSGLYTEILAESGVITDSSLDGFAEMARMITEGN